MRSPGDDPCYGFQPLTRCRTYCAAARMACHKRHALALDGCQRSQCLSDLWMLQRLHHVGGGPLTVLAEFDRPYVVW